MEVCKVKEPTLGNVEDLKNSKDRKHNRLNDVSIKRKRPSAIKPVRNIVELIPAGAHLPDRLHKGPGS